MYVVKGATYPLFRIYKFLKIGLFTLRSNYLILIKLK